MSESEFLDQDEIVELTGHKQARAQVRWLYENEIRFLVNGKGAPIVGRHYLRQLMAGEQTTSEETKKEHKFVFRGLSSK